MNRAELRFSRLGGQQEHQQGYSTEIGRINSSACEEASAALSSKCSIGAWTLAQNTYDVFNMI